MFDPSRALQADPALFACYVLFVYFRGVNVCRIEREMRALGYSSFHRRNLYPRGRQPGWIAKYNWSADTLVRMRVASTRKEGHDSTNSFAAGGEADMSVRTPLDFHSWLRRVSPGMTWEWKHQEVIIDQLRKVTEGDCKRLMIFLPPRHGKSELVSVRYTAWRMQKDPSMNVILGSYNQRLADRMSRKIRTVVCDSEAIRLGADRSADTLVRMSVASTRRECANGPNSSISRERLAGGTGDADRSTDTPVRTDAASASEKDAELSTPPFAASGDADMSVRAPLSPFPFSRPRPKNAVSEWETTAGGSFRAVGAGSGVTGFGANLIVIDDPVKNRAQAESETFRNRVWDWYKDDLYTRLEPDGSIVLIQTRWHEDDLAGRLLRDDLDDWTVINLPALSEPEHTGVVEQGRYQDAADIGGNPTGREGVSVDLKHPVKPTSFDWRTAPNIALCPERFPVEALEQQRRQLGTYSFSALYQQRPTPAGGQIFKREWFKQILDFAPPGLKWKRGYDLAVSTRTESDYTASFRCAFDDKTGNLYISGGFRRRIEFPEQRRYIHDRMLNEPDTEHGVELALHGQALLQELRRDPSIRGKSLRGVKVSTDKVTRALTWSPLAEEGKVILIRSAARSADTPVRMSVASTRRESVDSPGSFAGRTGDADKGVRTPHFQDWISDLLDELVAFPNGTHDDQIDAISIAVQMAAKRQYRAGGLLVT